MQNTHATATPETIARATITPVGEVISDTFFTPVESDMFDGLLGRCAAGSVSGLTTCRNKF
ncbi:MAG: hypothetical protein WCC49_15250 [Pantoea agglomerans]